MVNAFVSGARTVVITLALVGCGNTFPNDQAHADAAIRSVRQRAGFDMDCPNLQLQRLGDVARLGQQMTSMTIGASGCGKKSTYIVECVSNWGDITCTAKANTSQAGG